MKKYLIAVALLLGACLPARAGVPCTVPFQLTNGTLTDATQVMANYNAILTCLSSQAAALGANNDITALNALTTPLTPAQGAAAAVCGVSGFNAVNTVGHTATEISITYTQAIVTTGVGQVQFGGAASLTLNLGTTGANGLDAGSLGASSIYYLYLIGKGPAAPPIASLASLSSTNPSLPSGYTYFCRVAAWETGSGSALLLLQTNGRRTTLTQASSGAGSNITGTALSTTAAVGSGCATNTPTFAFTTFSGIPPTALRAFGTVQLNFASIFVAPFQATTIQTQGVNFAMGGNQPTGSTNIYIQFDLLLAASQGFFVCSSSTNNGVVIGGWDDSVNAN